VGRYLVYGAGAIGGTIAARLARAGVEVRLVARGEHLAAIRRDGLTLADPDGDERFRIPAFEHPAEVEVAADDIVVLAMKTQDTAAALDELAACADPAATIVCAQNGVENERLALRRFGDVLAMYVHLTAEHLEPGVVRAFSSPVPGVLDLGPVGSGDGPDRTAAIAADLSRAGFASRALDDPGRWKHAKLLANMVNAATVVAGPDGRGEELRERARAEAIACFDAAAIEWAGDEEVAERAAVVSPIRPVGGREWSGSSTWQSLARGSGATEVDYINGEVVLLGRLWGVPTPVNRTLQHLVGRMAREGAAPGDQRYLAELEGRTDAGNVTDPDGFGGPEPGVDNAESTSGPS
jgi:2-dehydropantoate 2-reductase